MKRPVKRFTTSEGKAFLLKKTSDENGDLRIDIIDEADLRLAATLGAGGDHRCNATDTVMVTNMTGLNAVIARNCMLNDWAHIVGARDLGGGRYGQILRFDKTFLQNDML